MPRKWRQARWWRLRGGQRVSSEAAATFRTDRRRQIDAVIDYFGVAAKPVQPARASGGSGSTRRRSAGTSALGGAWNSKVFTTDGPFAETKEQLGL
jgi:hypothetical protein